jgi:hypothetical protein
VCLLGGCSGLEAVVTSAVVVEVDGDSIINHPELTETLISFERKLKHQKTHRHSKPHTLRQNERREDRIDR